METDDPIETVEEDERPPTAAGAGALGVAAPTAAHGGAVEEEAEEELVEGTACEETVPASPDTLLTAVRMHQDGTMAAGGGDDLNAFGEDAQEETVEEPAKATVSSSSSMRAGLAALQRAAAKSALPRVGADAAAAAVPEVVVQQDRKAELSDGSDAEVGTEGVPLADEPWMSLPVQQRDLWERVRPRALRREAAQLRALRFPMTTMNRLMKLNPSMNIRSAEAAEVINYATVLITQALVRSALRERASTRAIVQFSDVRQACVNAQELQFLAPLDSTLDASALAIRADAASAFSNLETNEAAAQGRAGARRVAAPVDTGPQKRLMMAAFAQGAREEPETSNVEDSAEAVAETPAVPQEGAVKAAASGAAASGAKKRKGGAAPNGSGKSARTASGPAPKTKPAETTSKLSNFFRRAELAGS